MHRPSTARVLATLTCAVVLAASCDVGHEDKGGLDLSALGETGENGKADFARRAHLVDSVGPDARVEGTFDPQIRVYGFIVEAKAGATVDIQLTATAGADAHGLADGDVLDTILGVFGPYQSPSEPGERIVEVDDGPTVAAPPVRLNVEQNGRYLVAFSSWDDTGTGEYELDLSCTGTDFQCQRPSFALPCTPGQLFIQGGRVDETTEWNTCEVILLENTVVDEEATLTIRPGVTVRGNYLSANNNDRFGTVGLDVQGRLQAVGTAEHPIAFTNLVDDRGWNGIMLQGPGHSIEHAFVEHARVGIRVQADSTADVTSVVIEGGVAGQPSTHGVLVEAEGVATFRGTLIKGNTTGMEVIESEDVVVIDSVIRDNGMGVRVRSTGQTINSCVNTNPPPAPTFWRDPRITHTDIIHNTAGGIEVFGNEVLLQVEHSNLVANGGPALQYRGLRTNPDSFIRSSNIFGNNGNNEIQVRSFHRVGVLDVTGNHWVHISDPELGATRSGCNADSLRFSGFSPVRFDDAGPRLQTVIETVKESSHFGD